MAEEQKQLDLRGLTCPEPVIRTKKALDSAPAITVTASVDDDVCVNNLKRLANSMKASCEVKDKKGYFDVIIGKGTGAVTPDGHAHAVPSKQTEATASTGAGTVVFIGKDQFGQGDEEFSRTLMNLFLQTTFESGLRPRAILLVNTGVKLMAPESQALKVLNDFRDAGVEVFACGLCVEFYGLKGKIATEQITSMFAICEYLFAADRIVQP